MKAKNYYEEQVDLAIIEELCKDDLELKTEILSLDRKNKRIAILDIMANNSKDISYFYKISDIIKLNKSNSFLHITSIVQMLREYVGVSECAVKEFAEVMTPLELVEEILDKLSKHVWTNPNLKWKDPANGCGIFICIIVLRLMEGLKEFEPNDDLRYKHIIENMIYVCEIQTKNMFLYLCTFDPYDEYNLNIYNGDYLANSYQPMELWGIDKFDIIVCNPPYNTGLLNRKTSVICNNNDDLISKAASIRIDSAFVVQSYNYLNTEGYNLFIWPFVWTQLPSWQKFRAWIKNNGLVSINASNIMFADAATNVAVTLQQKNYKGDCYINNPYKNANNIKINLNYDIIPDVYGELGYSIFEKAYTFNPKLNYIQFKNFDINTHKYFSMHGTAGGRNSSNKNKTGQTIGINTNISKFSKASKLMASIIKPEDFYLTNTTPSISVILFDDQDHKGRYKKYHSSNLYNFILHQLKVNFMNSKDNIGMLPDVCKNMIGDYTDDKAYKILGLSDEEISHIENTVKLSNSLITK